LTSEELLPYFDYYSAVELVKIGSGLGLGLPSNLQNRFIQIALEAWNEYPLDEEEKQDLVEVAAQNPLLGTPLFSQIISDYEDNTKVLEHEIASYRSQKDELNKEKTSLLRQAALSNAREKDLTEEKAALEGEVRSLKEQLKRKSQQTSASNKRLRESFETKK